jgi:hypothetical protein
MSILNRLSRIPLLQQHRNVHKLIRTSAVARMSTKSEPAINSVTTARVGRHRSTKLKRNKTIATLPGKINRIVLCVTWKLKFNFNIDSFLSTNYIRHSKLLPLSDQYSSFIPDYVWWELINAARSGLVHKGSIAAFNHTDHLALSVPHRGACYLLDHIVHKMAAHVKADVLILDSQDFVFLAQHSFNRDGNEKAKY